ncbi:TIGR01177 family methyltransferase [Halobacteriales archaeon QS_5_70_15]|nr:MAG: TIGR01177 family methyltransferase [Halobacteriales archaeon QS_5_70_15]
MYVLELAGQHDDPLATLEARAACSGVEPLAPGLATADGLSNRIADLALTRTACELLARTGPTVGDAVAALRATLDGEGSDLGRGGEGSDLGRGTVRVRARDIRGLTGVSTGEAERRLGDVLTDRGYGVDLEDPDRELRALFTEGVCAIGWVEGETAREFGSRRPTDRPFFQPGSMDPMLARALVNVAGARPGASVVDPMCGTGGLLLEAGLVGARVLGVDAQWKMVRGAAENLAAYLDGGFATVRGDATRLPVRDGAADAVVFDAPYDRQSKVVGDLAALVSDALGEARRIAPRTVLVADRSWTDEAREAGWTVDERIERRVHRSLVRQIHLLVDRSGH